MLDKVSHLAEQVATKASRREFFGRVGRTAMTAAVAVGGALALPAIVAARQGDLCSSTNSTSLCVNNVVGGSCGANGKCTAVKGTVNDCYCRQTGDGGGGPR
ncbi:MAG TPA: hypothetical protein VM165_00865 [Planctomycetaceae bacterium]|nr:hypothetical protein [Planctomycetaceae bacterium]